ncbi:MAG TPA: glycosyltransferase [Pyrinomonadaceae bacterium]|jgi:glycosyltransferase involved in cell wall biosynthesis
MRTKKVAWLSPLPPQRSGIAHYSYWLIKALQTHLDIDLYYDTQAPTAAIKNDFDVYPLSHFAGRYQRYDEVIYHLGNHSDFHKEIYKLAWNFPGTVVLHDYNISAFMHDAFYCQNDEQLYKQALMEGYGDEGRKEFQALAHGRAPDIAKFPMSHAVVARSRKAIVHHRWVKNQFADNEHVKVVPLYAKLDFQLSAEDTKLFKNKFSISDSRFLVTCLGFVNSNKLPQLQVEVVERLIDDGYPVQMMFAGEPAPDIKSLEREVRAGKYARHITFTGYQDEADYFRAIFASDIIINLRNPSMGEASLTLMHALAAAKPTIVSNINQYREFPDKVCWKLTHDENEAEMLYAYLSALLRDRHLRAAISSNSARYARSVLGPERIIARWMQIL